MARPVVYVSVEGGRAVRLQDRQLLKLRDDRVPDVALRIEVDRLEWLLVVDTESNRLGFQ